MGLFGATSALFSAESHAGLRLATIDLNWNVAEPANGQFNEAYFQSMRARMAAEQAAGLSPILLLGVQYAPSWVFNLDPASRFVDQYGDVWTGNTAGGDGVANGVFSNAVRTAIQAYVARVFAELGTSFAAVRWGGGLPYDEARYPDCPGGRANCFWAFDANARAQDPVPSYVPGQGPASEAQTFVNWYERSMTNYIAWGLGMIRRSFHGEIDVLLPGWGIRPGDLQNAVNVDLNGSTYRSDAIAAGLNWADQLPAYATYGPIRAWSTWLNETDYANDAQDWSPIHYIASILPAGMTIGGENTWGRATLSDLNATLSNARAFGLTRVLWMSEFLAQQPGNATIQQIGLTAQR